MRALDAWLEGSFVGRFTETDDRHVLFEYDPGAPSTQISLSLPRNRPHTKNAAKHFLENLLPDHEATRTRMARVYAAAGVGTFDLLAKSGVDVAGGLVLVPAGTEPATGLGHLFPAPDDVIANRIAEIKNDPDAWAPSDTFARFSLGGTQGKFALARVDGEWFWPNAAVPSTHIVKPARPEMLLLEQAETAAMRLAMRIGLSAPAAEVFEVEDQSAYMVQRFDRLPGDPFASRLHVEDLAQASFMSPNDKYSLTAVQALALLAPEDQDSRLAHQFISQLAFNTMLGNADAHAKNYSVILRPGTASTPAVELSPMYDVVPVGLYPYNQDLAMRIGGATRPQAIQAHHWRKLASRAGLDSDEVMAIVGNVAEGIAANVNTAWVELEPEQQTMLREQLLRNTDRFVGLNETKQVEMHVQPSTPPK
ncbi:HipA domain-containing protein [Agreia sp.]|uniref:HipA domain-containing protein n=1 Tax=Agreia sp. TaxID=1872416 RepID=UPI0035BC0132